MKKETLELLIKFKEKTGVMPLSARMQTGSMKGFILFTMPYSEEIRNFCSNDNYYQKGNKNFNGVHITYLGNSFTEGWHISNGYEFDVKIEELT